MTDPHLSVATPRRVALATLAALVALLPAARSQEPTVDPRPESAAPQDPGPERSSAEALRSLAQSIDAKTAERDRLADTARAAQERGDEAARAQANAGVQAAEAQLATLRRQFESIASEVDIDEFESADDETFNLNHELINVLRPIIEELKDATETPREMERLRTEIEVLGRRRATAARAIERLDRQLEKPADRAWVPELERALESWRRRVDEIRSREAVARQQLYQREQSQKSVWQSSTDLASDFFRSRGLNLAIGIGALLVVFFGLRFTQRAALRLGPLKRRRQLTFYGRLARVLSSLLIGVAALSAMLLAFYAVNDWLLLLVTLVFLLGLGWASLRMLPRFFEQVRMLLNLGPVREGERIVHDGVPWRVQRLQFYSYLINPQLTGGLLRVPLEDLLGLHSRPIGSDEIWFPTNRGDWVIFEDGRRAEVILQSPDLVQLRQLGGALITCRTDDFIGMRVLNLSHGFRITTRFGVDYAHQRISTREIPALMRAKLGEELAALVDAEHLVDVKVEFAEAGASSLDYEVLAEFTGAVARDYARIRRAIARVLVDACNEHRWTIPFTQLTVHQAG